MASSSSDGRYRSIYIRGPRRIRPTVSGHYLARGSVDRAKRSVKRIVPDLDLNEVEFVLPEQPTSTSEHQTGALTKLMSKTYAPVTILLFIFGFVSWNTAHHSAVPSDIAAARFHRP